MHLPHPLRRARPAPVPACRRRRWGLPRHRHDAAWIAQIEEIFSRYGQLRSIQKIFGTKGGGGGEDGAPPGGEEGSAFRVEYFNIQVTRSGLFVVAPSHPTPLHHAH
jgi:hypothetical protein